MMDLKAYGLNVAPGDNSLALAADLHFPPGDRIKDVLANFVAHIQDLGPGHTTEMLTAAGVGFGFDKDHHLKFLETSMLGLSSSSVITQKTVDYFKQQLGLSGNSTVDPQALLNNVEVSKLHVDGTSALKIDAAAMLKNVSLKAQASIGYAALGAYVDKEEYIS
jgi:hypothetical protein